jgi:hypothetical protein
MPDDAARPLDMAASPAGHLAAAPAPSNEPSACVCEIADLSQRLGVPQTEVLRAALDLLRVVHRSGNECEVVIDGRRARYLLQVREP